MGALSPDIEALLGPCSPGPDAASPPVAESVPPRAGGDSRDITVTRTGGESAMGAFEAADRYDKSLAMWASPIQSADADILPDKELVDGRSRDMLRNDAYVQGGANLHKDNIVGSHFLPNARPATDRLARTGGKSFDAKWEEEFQAEAEELFDLVAESPENYLDASRQNTVTGLVRMAVGIHVAAGEVLATAEWDRDTEFRTAIQMVDLDRLSDPMFLSLEDRKMVRGGIRFNQNGVPQVAYIRTQHPNDIRWDYTLPEWKPVPFSKPWGRTQVIHLKEQVRPDQSRGIAEMASALKAMRFGHKLRDLNLQRIVTQSLYAASITSDMPTEQIFAQLGGQSAEEATAAFTQYAQGFLGAIGQYAGSAKNLHIDGVKIPHLFPGTKLDLLSPTKDSISGSEFEQSLLRYIAASIGVSYEQLSRDYTNTNYSSARAAMTETWKFMQSRKKLIADRFASIIWRLWLEEAINNNHLSTLPKSKAGLFYTGGRLNLNFDAVSRVDWIGASRGQIDELKETQAAIARIDAGISTREDELARLGKDWRKVFRQLEREARLAQTLKLVFTSKDSGATTGANSNDTAAEERKAA